MKRDFPTFPRPVMSAEHYLLDELVVGLRRKRDLDRAAAAADELAAQGKLNPEDADNLACVYALAAGVVRQDAKLPTAERERRAETCATRAMELRRPGLKEYFARNGTVRHLRTTDRDLDALRPRKDFQEFAAGLDRR